MLPGFSRHGRRLVPLSKQRRHSGVIRPRRISDRIISHHLALTPGTRLGVYEVAAAIGEGGMGQVYRARDTKLNRDVAPKSFLMHSPAIPTGSRGSPAKRRRSRR
jgi:serine/threonine protein kinase